MKSIFWVWVFCKVLVSMMLPRRLVMVMVAGVVDVGRVRVKGPVVGFGETDISGCGITLEMPTFGPNFSTYTFV